MRIPLIIYGAGGWGREVLAMLNALEAYEPVGFLDDLVAPGISVGGLRVLGGVKVLAKMDKPVHLIVAGGNPNVRRQIVDSLSGVAGVQYETLVHPTAVLQSRDRIQVGEGSVIQAHVILTTDIRLGRHTLLNLNCTVGHDVVLDDFASLMPGVNLAGGVMVGKEVLIGSGATVINRLRIGHRAIVGAGAVVTRDVPKGATVVGVPAQVIKTANE